MRKNSILRGISLLLAAVLFITSFDVMAFAGDVSDGCYFETVSENDIGADGTETIEDINESEDAEETEESEILPEPEDYFTDEVDEETDGPFTPIEFEYSSACEVVTTASRAKELFAEWKLSESIKSKLNVVLAGKFGLYDLQNNEISAPIGSRAVTDDRELHFFYTNAAGNRTKHTGWTCFVYANAVYSFLFGDIATDRFTHTPRLRSVQPTYGSFTKNSIRCGDYAWYQGSNGWQHAQLILHYDENEVSILEGNADGRGLIDIVTLPWSEYATFVGKYGGISYITQVTEEKYKELYPADKVKKLYFSIDADGNLKYSKTDIASGTTGNLQWVLNDSGGLSVVGKGNASVTSENGEYRSPWYDYFKDIVGVKIIASEMTDSSYLFKDFPKVKTFDISGLDLSNLRTATEMFAGCSWLANFSFAGENIIRLSNVKGMFKGCSALKVLDFGNCDFAGVKNKDQEDLLAGCTGLQCIYSPVNIGNTVSILLPENKIWLDSEGNVIDKLPVMLTKSERIEAEGYEDPNTLEGKFSFASAETGTSQTAEYYVNLYDISDEFGSYDQKLAEASLEISMAALSDRSAKKPEANIKKLLSNSKFKNVSIDYAYNSSLGNNQVGSAMAIMYKNVAGNNDTFILVALSDENCKQAWAGDLDVGDSSEVDHKGYKNAANTALKRLKSYINSNKKNIKGDLYIWITGYGRGASIANLMAARIDETGLNDLEYKMAAYCFQGAPTTNSTEISEDKYKNIFNLVSHEDLYTSAVPDAWEMTRYGETYYFPEVSEQPSNLYDASDIVSDHLRFYLGTRDEYAASFGKIAQNTALNAPAKFYANNFSKIYAYILKGLLMGSPSGNYTGDKVALYENLLWAISECGTDLNESAIAHSPERWLDKLKQSGEGDITGSVKSKERYKDEAGNLSTVFGNGIVSLVKDGTSYRLKAIPAEGESFLAWYREDTEISGELVMLSKETETDKTADFVYALFTDNANVYKESGYTAFCINDDTVPDVIVKTHEDGTVAFPNIDWTDVDFRGWFTAPFGQGEEVNSGRASERFMTLYAYVTKECIISFSDEGAFKNELSSASLIFENIRGISGCPVENLPVPVEPAGFVFGGWFTEKDGMGDAYIAGETVVTENVTLFSYWMRDGFTVSEIADPVYTGKALKPAIKVYDGTKLLKEGKDYTLTYTNNKNAAESTDFKAPLITIKGKGNYSGTKKVSFSVKKKNIGDSDVTAKDILVNENKGNPVKISPVIKYNGMTITEKDYTYEIYKVNEDPYEEIPVSEVITAGNYIIRVTGKNNFEGSRDISLTVAELKLMSKTTVSAIKDQSYTGDEIKPPVSVKYGKKKVPASAYTLSYENNVKAGTAKVTLTGIESEGYTGTKTVSFKIKAASIKNAVIKNANGSKFTASYVTDGTPVMPDISVSIKSGNVTKTLVKGLDYKVTYKNNTRPGKATLIVSGINYYSGSVKKTFTVKAYDIKTDKKEIILVEDKPLNDDGTVTLSDEDAIIRPYTKGGAYIENIRVKCKGTLLKAGTDYTLSYKNNNKIGKAEDKKAPTVYIVGRGLYTGKIAVKFTITKSTLSAGYIFMTASDTVFSKKAGKYASAPVLKDVNGKKLESGVDYEKITYTYNDACDVSAGEETIHREAGDIIGKKDIVPAGTVIDVTVFGKGKYEDQKTCSYTVKSGSIAKATVKIGAKTYTGKSVTLSPEDIKVTLSGNTQPLVFGEDYEIVSYSNNVNKGKKAVVVIRGIGNYTGKISKKFTIKAKIFAFLSSDS